MSKAKRSFELEIGLTNKPSEHLKGVAELRRSDALFKEAEGKGNFGGMVGLAILIVSVAVLIGIVVSQLPH